MSAAKPFSIRKELVWKAYQQVKRNGGASGVDAESLTDFESDLKNNLYRIWNRMSSGSYFPPAVRAVEIPKKTGGVRTIGVPTISDRIAQTVVKMVLEPILEPLFDSDSYGYRPGKSAHDAVSITRKRCWQFDWVVEFDIKGLFDHLDHRLLMKALRAHCSCKWVLLYVERWLRAPMQKNDGSVEERHRGTPQGGVVSPLLANLFLHYAFDSWMRRTFPKIQFCRYADDGLAHCRTQYQAEYLANRIKKRFREVGLELNPDKTGIVYCKDSNRKESHAVISFDFLGFTFRPRRCVNPSKGLHPNFLPAASRGALKSMHREIRSWHIQLKNTKTLLDLSRMLDPVLRGWMQYYGKFYPRGLWKIWRSLDAYLVQWVRRKHKRFAKYKGRARRYLNKLARSHPKLFVHWDCGYFPAGPADRSRMS